MSHTCRWCGAKHETEWYHNFHVDRLCKKNPSLQHLAPAAAASTAAGGGSYTCWNYKCDEKFDTFEQLRDHQIMCNMLTSEEREAKAKFKSTSSFSGLASSSSAAEQGLKCKHKGCEQTESSSEMLEIHEKYCTQNPLFGFGSPSTADEVVATTFILSGEALADNEALAGPYKCCVCGERFWSEWVFDQHEEECKKGS